MKTDEEEEDGENTEQEDSFENEKPLVSLLQDKQMPEEDDEDGNITEYPQSDGDEEFDVNIFLLLNLWLRANHDWGRCDIVLQMEKPVVDAVLRVIPDNAIHLHESVVDAVLSLAVRGEVTNQLSHNSSVRQIWPQSRKAHISLLAQSAVAVKSKKKSG